MYIDQFKSKEDVADQYSGCSEEFPNSGDKAERDRILNLLNDSEVLLAWYETGSYDGSSFVLYRHKGKLYEVNASHCSCYGLEGQWDPEETNWKALEIRDFWSSEQVLKDALEEIISLYKD